MPVHKGKDNKGSYYQYGGQKKYYFTPGKKQSEDAAKKRAGKQGRAVHSNKGK